MSGPPRPTGPPRPGGAPVVSVAGGPPAPAPGTVPTKREGFSWTPQDVADAVEDLLAPLGPVATVQAAEEDPVLIAVESDKNGKTVNSIPVPTNLCDGLPIPAGSKRVVMHFDNQAKSSFLYFLAEHDIQLKCEMPTFVRMDAPKGRFKGRVKKSDPGYAKYVAEVVFACLEKMAERGDIGGLTLDGCGDFISDYGNDIALYLAGVEEFKQMDRTDWMPRRIFFADLMGLLEKAVCRGGYVVVNGPDNKDDGEEKVVIVAGKAVKKAVKAKWLAYREIEKPLHVAVHIDHGEAEDGSQVWVAKSLVVRDSKFPGIGSKVDITRKNVGALLAAKT